MGRDTSLDPYGLVKEWLGLAEGHGTYEQGDVALTEDNDNGKPFKEIAAIIRNEPEGLIA